MKKHLYYLLLLCIVLSTACKKNAEKEMVADTVPKEAIPFPLSDLRLLEGSPFKHAMNKNAEWLLDLEPDRFLHRFRLNAGLEPKGEIYGGWESRGVSGHTLGHYLSACAMMYAASGDNRFKERVDYIVKELAECQQARGTGYVGGIPEEDRIWSEVAAGDIRSEGFDLNGGWVPWYTQHKIWAGLIDSYLYADNNQAKEVAVKLTDWAVKSFGGLNEEQFQKMLACEFGGMNESLAEMYAITGNNDYLKLAENFYHKAILDPLKEKRDELAGKHANTQVPKIIGAARLYELTADEKYRTISTFFWDRIVNHHSYLNGGNSNYEHLGPPDQLNDRLSPLTSETCNTYNMLKLTKHLFTWEAAAPYMDYYERALYNHILASQNPHDGMVCYSVPLESGTEKVFSTRFESFWCCVASGIENHVKYAESVFFQSGDDGLFVNLFIPTALDWKAKGLKVKMETAFPEESKIHITFEGSKKTFPIYIRYPKWATSGIKAAVNGTEKEVIGAPGTYFMLQDEWGSGTELVLDLPMSLHTESMPDNPNRIGIFYGPVLLATPLGKEEIKAYDIPVFIADRAEEVPGLIRPVPEQPLAFESDAFSRNNLQLIPFYRIHDEKHAVYFDIFTPSDWEIKEKEYLEAQERQKQLEARTVDMLRIGEMQPERDHNLQSENSDTGDAHGHKYRHAYNGWFSFDVKVDPEQPMLMLCSFWGADKDNRNFDILIDGEIFQTVSLQGNNGAKTFEMIFEIPRNITRGKDKIQVKFQAHPDNYAGGLFGFRILKK